MTKRQQDFAALMVRRWAAYRKAWHNLTPVQRRNETARLERMKAQWAKEGRMPWPSESQECSADHALVSALDIQHGPPSRQECYLSVELLAKLHGFASSSFLATHAGKPWEWWRGGLESTKEARAECFGFLVVIAEGARPWK